MPAGRWSSMRIATSSPLRLKIELGPSASREVLFNGSGRIARGAGGIKIVADAGHGAIGVITRDHRIHTTCEGWRLTAGSAPYQQAQEETCPVWEDDFLPSLKGLPDAEEQGYFNNTSRECPWGKFPGCVWCSIRGISGWSATCVWSNTYISNLKPACIHQE